MTTLSAAGNTAATPVPDVPPDQAFSVTLHLQTPAFMGDTEYHITLTTGELAAIFSGQAQWVKLPPRFGAANETRYVPLQNVMEVTLHDLVWPPVDTIAEARG